MVKRWCICNGKTVVSPWPKLGFASAGSALGYASALWEIKKEHEGSTRHHKRACLQGRDSLHLCTFKVLWVEEWVWFSGFACSWLSDPLVHWCGLLWTWNLASFSGSPDAAVTCSATCSPVNQSVLWFCNWMTVIKGIYLELLTNYMTLKTPSVHFRNVAYLAVNRAGYFSWS